MGEAPLSVDWTGFTIGPDGLTNYIVLYRQAASGGTVPPLAFQCWAAHPDHAEEQCEAAYPGVDILWVWSGPFRPGPAGAQAGLEEYGTLGLEDV